jgi:phospholipase C
MLHGVPAMAQIPQVQHVVVIVQENRTPDNLFHGLNLILPGADIANTGVTSTGQTVPLVQASLISQYDMSHAYVEFHTQYDNGRMDGDDLVTCTALAGATCPPLPGFVYIEPSQTQPYLDMATHYGFANRMFQTNRGPSLPAHLAIFAGGGEPIANSNLFDGNNNNNADVKVSGCVSARTGRLQLVGPNGMVAENVFPCFEHQTIGDLLDQPPANPGAPLPWKYYVALVDGILNPANAIRHICQPKTANGVIACTGPHFVNGDIYQGPQQFLRDVMANQLAAVTFINPPPASSDHAIACDDTGPSWVSAIVDTVGESAFWNNTVIFVTWDDWGGWYDHVAPPNDALHGYYENGFRVPLLVISPYTQPGYVSNVTHDFGSMLKFIENVFNLGLIAPGTFADSKADGLADFFNFQAPPRAFVPISAPYPVSYFLNEKSRINPRNRFRDADD